MSEIHIVEGPAPFEAKFTGTYEDTGYRPNPGALFKITSKFDKPVSISNATLYAYDKSGNQVELSLYDGTKSRFAQDSKQGLLELAPGQTKELVHSVHEGMLPADVDALQLEITAWETADGGRFQRQLDAHQFENRPKDGWK